MYGGTTVSGIVKIIAVGLSPRVRGNLVPPIFILWCGRSIPACTGEPTGGWVALVFEEVYPRVYGGTFDGDRRRYHD